MVDYHPIRLAHPVVRFLAMPSTILFAAVYVLPVFAHLSLDFILRMEGVPHIRLSAHYPLLRTVLIDPLPMVLLITIALNIARCLWFGRRWRSGWVALLSLAHLPVLLVVPIVGFVNHLTVT